MEEIAKKIIAALTPEEIKELVIALDEGRDNELTEALVKHLQDWHPLTYGMEFLSREDEK